MAFAQRLASGPSVALGQLRRLMRASFDRGLRSQLEAESAAFRHCARSVDSRPVSTPSPARAHPRQMFICRVGAIHKRLAARESESSPASRGRISLASESASWCVAPHDQKASTNRRCLELSRLMRKRNQVAFPCIALAAHPRVPRPLRRHRGAPRPELMAGMAH